MWSQARIAQKTKLQQSRLPSPNKNDKFDRFEFQTQKKQEKTVHTAINITIAFKPAKELN